MSKLQDQLDQITANTRNLVQPERLEISERAVAELYAAGVEDRILQVGSQAPEFALPDAAGRIVHSVDLLALGPLVINYGLTAFGIVVPVIVLYAAGRLGGAATLLIAFAASLAAPLLLYRLSWGWWLALYYLFLPGNLPANLEGRAEDDM